MNSARVMRRPLQLDRWLAIGGLLLVGVCSALYWSGTSRATAVWILPLALGIAVVGGVGWAGRTVPDRVYYLLGAWALLLIVLGAWTLVIAIAATPMAT